MTETSSSPAIAGRCHHPGNAQFSNVTLQTGQLGEQFARNRGPCSMEIRGSCQKSSNRALGAKSRNHSGVVADFGE